MQIAGKSALRKESSRTLSRRNARRSKNMGPVKSKRDIRSCRDESRDDFAIVFIFTLGVIRKIVRLILQRSFDNIVYETTNRNKSDDDAQPTISKRINDGI